MLHTACRTLHGACTPHIAHCQCMHNTLSLASSIVGTLRPVFLVPSPARSSRVHIGTVSTQIATWQACVVPQSALVMPVRAGDARARCRLATVPLVRTVSATHGIVRAVLSTVGTLAPSSVLLVHLSGVSCARGERRTVNAARREYLLRCTSFTARRMLHVVSCPVHRASCMVHA
jgi:hypothetical protein